MKRILFLSCMALLALSCGGNQPAELYVPKNTVEFAGNAFQAFSLGADVKIYTSPAPDNKGQWTVQAVVPVRKEAAGSIGSLEINLTPLDERGIRVRDGFVLAGEDLDNLVPVYNAGNGVERTIVFSVPEMSGGPKYFSAKEASGLIEKTKGVRMDFNVADGKVTAAPAPAQAKTGASAPAASAKEEYPMTLDGQLRRFGMYGRLNQYENALRNKEKKKAKQIEDQMWEIEKRVKKDPEIPQWLRERFVDYVEDKEDEIEKRY